MSLRPLWLLLLLRARVTARTLVRKPSVLGGMGIALFVFGPAALAAARDASRQFAELPPERVPAFLGVLLLTLQGVWLLLLLLPGGWATLGRAVPPSLVKPMPARPWHVAGAAALGALLDLPLLFALPTLWAVFRNYSVAGGAAAVFTAALLVALLLQTAAAGQVLEQGAALLARGRRSSAWAVLVAALALGVYFGLPPALAATTEKPSVTAVLKQAPAPAPVAEQQPSAAIERVVRWLPSGIAAMGLQEAERGRILAAAGYLLALAALAVGTLAGAAQLLQLVWTREATAGAATRQGWRPPRPDTATIPEPPTAWQQVRAVAAHEWRGLTRAPQAHLGLRTPASLLLAVFLAWIAPDLGADSVRNMWDLLGMGVMLYAALWQVQLLCDRFGNEAGTARLLLGFPVARTHLIAGRNLALGGLLLLVDGLVIAGLCLVAEKPHLIVPFLLWLPATVVALTAAGNVVSVMAPFPIAKRGEKFEWEPEKSLAFLYVLLGLSVWALLWPLTLLPLWAQPLAGAAVLAALYAGSLFLAARVLARREPQIIRMLDGR
jgi:hypothetical protein